MHIDKRTYPTNIYCPVCEAQMVQDVDLGSRTVGPNYCPECPPPLVAEITRLEYENRFTKRCFDQALEELRKFDNDMAKALAWTYLQGVKKK